MFQSIVLSATANAGDWQIAKKAADGKFYGDQKAIDLNFAAAGLAYAGPYHVYHDVIDAEGFLVPFDSNNYETDSNYNSNGTLRTWSMKVKHNGAVVSQCDSGGEIMTADCDDGNYCNWGCDGLMTQAECESNGFTEGCFAESPEDATNGNVWIKTCASDWTGWGDSSILGITTPTPVGLTQYKNAEGKDCFSNDNSCCSHNGFTPQWITGAQFCNTIWMSCPSSGDHPMIGEEYDLEIDYTTVNHWWPTENIENSMVGTYVHRGDTQAYVGAYSCEQQYDDLTQDVCAGVTDKTSWKYSAHPNYSYNEYNFNYPAKPTSEDQPDKIVGAYWTEWAAYKRFIWEEEGTTSRRYYVQNTPFHQLTHVLYAFIPVCGNGDNGKGQLGLCVVNDCASEDPSELSFGNPYFNLRARACKFSADGSEAPTAGGTNLDSDFEVAIHDPWSAFHINGGQLLAMESVKQDYPDLKILPSIGGWTLSKMFFHMHDDANRAKFVQSCARFLRTWKVFDGIDIDWEFPGGSGQDDGVSAVDYWQWPMDSPSTRSMNKMQESGSLILASAEVVEAEGSDQDGGLYKNLMLDLRAMLDELETELGRDFRLTSAVSGGVDKIGKVPYGELADTMDNIFVMSYDFDGAWSDKVGHQTNLYQRQGTDVEATSLALETIAAQGFPMSKLGMGVGMYGRGWAGVTGGTPTKFYSDDGSLVDGIDYWGAPAIGAGEGDIEAGVKDYSTIASGVADGSCNYFFDECAQAPLAECSGNVWTYDNARSVKAKGDWVIANGAAGLFAWVLDQDNGDILNAMHEGLGHSIVSGTPVTNSAYPARPESCSLGTDTTTPVATTTTTTPVATTTTTPIPTTTTTPIATTTTTTTPIATTTTTTPVATTTTTTPIATTTTTPIATTTTTPIATATTTTTPVATTTTTPASTAHCEVIPGKEPQAPHCKKDTEAECLIFSAFCYWTDNGAPTTTTTTTTTTTAVDNNPNIPSGSCADVAGIPCTDKSEWDCSGGKYYAWGTEYDQYYISSLCPLSCATSYPTMGDCAYFYNLHGGH